MTLPADHPLFVRVRTFASGAFVSLERCQGGMEEVGLLTPQEARQLAAALIELADEAEQGGAS